MPFVAEIFRGERPLVAVGNCTLYDNFPGAVARDLRRRGLALIPSCRAAFGSVTTYLDLIHFAALLLGPAHWQGVDGLEALKSSFLYRKNN